MAGPQQEGNKPGDTRGKRENDTRAGLVRWSPPSFSTYGCIFMCLLVFFFFCLKCFFTLSSAAATEKGLSRFHGYCPSGFSGAFAAREESEHTKKPQPRQFSLISSGWFRWCVRHRSTPGNHHQGSFHGYRPGRFGGVFAAREPSEHTGKPQPRFLFITL